MKTPLISIITACFNNEKTINDTIESILNQTYISLEYILVDGSSSDSTVNFIESYERKFQEKRIQYKWISEPDNGIYDAWNKGLERATGDWIVFIGGDDYFKSDITIEETVPFSIPVSRAYWAFKSLSSVRCWSLRFMIPDEISDGSGLRIAVEDITRVFSSSRARMWDTCSARSVCD